MQRDLVCIVQSLATRPPPSRGEKVEESEEKVI